MQDLLGRLPVGLRKRPFDVFVALFLASAGVYEIADPLFPEMQQSLLSDAVLIIIGLYMFAAGLAITWCILHKCKNIMLNMYVEMYSWLFMWVAVVALTIFQIVIGMTESINNYALYYGVLWFWILLCFATGIRWLDLYHILRRIDK